MKKMRVTSALLEDLWSDDDGPLVAAPTGAPTGAPTAARVDARVDAPTAARWTPCRRASQQSTTLPRRAREAARLRRELARVERDLHTRTQLLVVAIALVALHLSSRLARAERRLMALRYAAGLIVRGGDVDDGAATDVGVHAGAERATLVRERRERRKVPRAPHARHVLVREKGIEGRRLVAHVDDGASVGAERTHVDCVRVIIENRLTEKRGHDISPVCSSGTPMTK